MRDDNGHSVVETMSQRMQPGHQEIDTRSQGSCSTFNLSALICAASGSADALQHLWSGMRVISELYVVAVPNLAISISVLLLAF